MRQRNTQKDKRLNVDEEYELIDWTERFGVSADKLREAVKMVGDQVTDVVKYLMDGNKTHRVSNP